MRQLQQFVALVTLALVFTGATPQDMAQVEKPEPKIGENRSYAILDPYSRVEQRTEDLTVSEITDSEIRISNKEGAIVQIYDKNWAQKQAGERPYTPAVPFLLFPMQIGKKWKHSHSSLHARCGTTTSELTNEVVAWEDVTVPAGTIRALRIDSKETWSNSCARGELEYKFWYSPRVRWLVKSESKTSARGQVIDGQIRELKAFRVD